MNSLIILSNSINTLAHFIFASFAKLVRELTSELKHEGGNSHEWGWGRKFQEEEMSR